MSFTYTKIEQEEEASTPVLSLPIPPQQIIEPLPRLDESMQFQNVQYITSGTHANIYKVELPNEETGETVVLCLKIFKRNAMLPYELETEAYEYLAHHGVYYWIPRVYGTAVRTPAQWGLDKVDGDEEGEYHGILMEWIEGGEWLSQDNLSADHVVSFVRGLVRIHDAGVFHNDSENQNMLVVPGSDRAVWIDFSCARVDATDEDKDHEMEYGATHPVLMVRLLELSGA